ncbi:MULTISPECIES: hypothetical protein [Fischerella]|nr:MULTISPECIES: hypothetical protein [Fischerella]
MLSGNNERKKQILTIFINGKNMCSPLFWQNRDRLISELPILIYKCHK